MSPRILQSPSNMSLLSMQTAWPSFPSNRPRVCSTDTICTSSLQFIVPVFLSIVACSCHIIFCSSPNETKRPRTLSRLSDTSVWERRKTKGKVAIQKMVVDLMELYLHRLRQKRYPYPKNPIMTDFAAQFPYNATPDQKQVLRLSLSLSYHHSYSLLKLSSSCRLSLMLTKI